MVAAAEAQSMQSVSRQQSRPLRELSQTLAAIKQRAWRAKHTEQQRMVKAAQDNVRKASVRSQQTVEERLANAAVARKATAAARSRSSVEASNAAAAARHAANQSNKPKQHRAACKASFRAADVTGQNVCCKPNDRSFGRHKLARMDKECWWCRALMWLEERVSFFTCLHYTVTLGLLYV